jgi:dihydroorotase
MEKFQILIPFDRHGHLRDANTLLPYVLVHSLKSFGGMVVMPNTDKYITTSVMAKYYRREIEQACDRFSRWAKNFQFIMTGYLTDITNPDDVEYGFKENIWKAMKLYPFGATTNSDKGVTDFKKISRVLERMEKIGMPLLVHPETDVSRSEIPFLDRERVYTEESLTEIVRCFPGLIMSVEHISTKEAAQFVEECKDNVVGTVTPHHLLYNHDAIFHGGVPPFKPGVYVENMCLPVLKTEEDLIYLRGAIMIGDNKHKFGAGTDTAPHTQEKKNKPGSCCGIFNSPYAVELYAMVFDEEGMLETKDDIIIFENFMSENNLWIYGIEKLQKEMVTLVKEEQLIQETYAGNIRPFKAGQTIPWTMKRNVE